MCALYTKDATQSEEICICMLTLDYEEIKFEKYLAT